MRHLIIYSHPNPKSFNHAILETATAALKARGNEVVVRDLYAMGFDPVLKASDIETIMKGSLPADIAAEQGEIRRADVLMFIFPIWWAGMPATMKGYIDRVFTKGFAYEMDEKGVKGLLVGKRALLFNTTGTPEQIYRQTRMFNSMNQAVEDGIFGFCGVKVEHHRYFCGVPLTDDAGRKNMLEEVERIVASL